MAELPRHRGSALGPVVFRALLNATLQLAHSVYLQP